MRTSAETNADPMPNRHAIRIAGMTAVLVAILGMPGAASASPLGGFKRAQFLVTAKGTQVTTWSYHHTGVPGAICDFDASGSGTETVRFHTSKATRVDAYAFGRVGGNFLKVGRTGVNALPGKASVSRSGHESATPTSSQPCASGEPGGAPPPAPDCGTRSLPLPLQLEFASATTARDLLTLDSHLLSPLGPFRNCPVSGTSFPNLLQQNTAGKQIGAKFPKRDVFDASLGKVIAIARGTRTESLDGEHTTTTHLRWEVTFLRLKPRHR